MKKIFWLILLFLIFLCILGCPSKKQLVNNNCCDTVIIRDTVKDEINIQQLEQYIQQLEDSITKLNNTIRNIYQCQENRKNKVLY